MMRQYIAAVLLLAVVILSNGENCDKLGILVYQDMGCTPSYDNSSACPTKYECQGLEESNEKCFFRGHAYNKGEEARNTAPCDIGCSCQADGVNLTNFKCEGYACQEWSHFLLDECYFTRTFDNCCATGQNCISSTEEQPKCVVDGRTYHKGEHFWPINTCYYCICDEGFEGKYEAPFCKRSDCSVQIKDQDSTQKKCAPVYLMPLIFKYSNTHFDNFCCPNMWICRDGTEEIKPAITPIHSDAKCSFGTTLLNIGDYFEKEIVEFGSGRKNIKCECKIPPLLTCFENADAPQ